MASFDVFDSFFIIKTSQEWGRTWYNPWQSKIEAKLHEESKFWRASKPLPNQSSVQGRESEKKSNTKEFCNHLRNFRKIEENFATTFEIFERQKKISQPLFTICEIFTTPFQHCENFATPFPLAKFSQLHISLEKSSCNLQIFLHRLH